MILPIDSNMKSKRGFHKVSSPYALRFRHVLIFSALLLAVRLPTASAANEPSALGVDPATLARTVTVHRDRYGVPHIDGPTDESVIFGFAYCQAEDYLWQIEVSYVGGLGRASELHGQESYK